MAAARFCAAAINLNGSNPFILVSRYSKIHSTAKTTLTHGKNDISKGGNYHDYIFISQIW
jgi:hypothetical protein